MHLNANELVDLAEGTRADASAPHLAGCDRCRRQLDDLRAMMSAAAEADVPQPSPLFWDRLSARVSDAVAAEGAPRIAWLGVSTWRHVLVPAWAVAAATIVVVVALSSRLMAPQPLAGIDARSAPPPPVLIADTNAGTDVLGDAASEDASLMLVASLTDDFDFDDAREAGLAPRGSAEHAVTHMSDGELRELGRILREELARTGA